MERSLGLEIKTTQILFGDVPISAYLMPDGKCCFSMRHLSKAIGPDEEWLIRTVKKEGKVLKKLKEYGFKGDISVLKVQNSIEDHFISATDFMAVIMYAAFVLMDRTAIAFLATSFNVGLEHLAVRSLLGRSSSTESSPIAGVPNRLAEAEKHQSPISGIPGQHLVKFAGLIPAEDLQDISEAITTDCRRVNPNDW